MVRSALYVPGNKPKMLSKVGTLGADAVVLDLEDAVPVEEKNIARAMVREALSAIEGPLRFVRVNGAASGLMEEDISSIFSPELDGIYLPKVESVEDLHLADTFILELEKRHGLEKGRVEVHPIFESAKGIIQAYQILQRSPSRVREVGFGAGDLGRELGLWFNMKLGKSDSIEFLYARSHIVLASRAAGKNPPLDSVYGNIRDLEGLEKDAVRARQLGFQGKSAIHPSQVNVINRVFTPSSEEIDFCRKIVTAFEEAEVKGSASFTVGDAFVDIAVMEQAISILKKFGDIKPDG